MQPGGRLMQPWTWIDATLENLTRALASPLMAIPKGLCLLKPRVARHELPWVIGLRVESTATRLCRVPLNLSMTREPRGGRWLLRYASIAIRCLRSFGLFHKGPSALPAGQSYSPGIARLYGKCFESGRMPVSGHWWCRGPRSFAGTIESNDHAG